jgi:uncharacterized protein (TIGR02246 family)
MPSAPSETAAIQATIDAMTSAFGRGDLDGILRTYEPDAVVADQPGSFAQGSPALRALFGQFLSLKPTFRFLEHEVIQAGDLALHLNVWNMRGTAPDGAAVEQGGLSVVVLRRQPDGRWLMVIDDPFGHAILDRVTHR